MRASSHGAGLLALALAACSTPPPAVDASIDAASPPADTGVHGIRWAMGPPLPQPLAYATASVFPVATDRYVYVFGGSQASRSDLGTISSAIYRARIEGDSLGAWEPFGDIAPTGTPLGLVGHGSLPINDAMGNAGAAFAGGGSLAGANPVVLAIYCDPADGHLFDWSAYPPILHEGHTFGAFVTFDPFTYAYVGGIVRTIPSAAVVSMSIRNDATSTEWTVEPSLPEPRTGHAAFFFANQAYVIGGENNEGPVADVVRTTRDAAGAVSGWETVGTIDGPPVGQASFAYRREAYLVGGVEGGTFDGAASARVRHAALDTDGHVGAFVDDADALPLPLASSALATDSVHYFLIGGMTGADLAATNAVVIGTTY